jgi:hypothetical protein
LRCERVPPRNHNAESSFVLAPRMQNVRSQGRSMNLVRDECRQRSYGYELVSG